ncbi:hypothetical protein V1503_02905 [Bacillus sp. SCS-151]|uniref:hypothetical protein n=1 Tax=Nanhaiella sioensis TaxID=3115293 RepID=UPI00397D9E72
MNKKLYQFLFLMSLFVIILLVFVNQSPKKINSYYFTLSGDSENWEVRNYKIAILPDKHKTGSTELKFKSKDGLKTNFYDFSVYTAISKEIEGSTGKKIVVEEETIYSQSRGGFIPTINEILIEKYESTSPLIYKGTPITIANIEEIYAEVLWEDESGQIIKEKISLYR